MKGVCLILALAAVSTALPLQVLLDVKPQLGSTVFKKIGEIIQTKHRFLQSIFKNKIGRVGTDAFKSEPYMTQDILQSLLDQSNVSSKAQVTNASAANEEQSYGFPIIVGEYGNEVLHEIPQSAYGSVEYGVPLRDPATKNDQSPQPYNEGYSSSQSSIKNAEAQNYGEAYNTWGTSNEQAKQPTGNSLAHGTPSGYGQAHNYFVGAYYVNGKPTSELSTNYGNVPSATLRTPIETSHISDAHQVPQTIYTQYHAEYEQPREPSFNTLIRRPTLQPISKVQVKTPFVHFGLSSEKEFKIVR